MQLFVKRRFKYRLLCRVCFLVLLFGVTIWGMVSPLSPQTNSTHNSEENRYRLCVGDQIELLCSKNNRVIDSVYRIHPNDVIFIQFPSLPNYSTELPVLPDGSVCIPRGEPLKISGLTIKEVKDTVEKIYSATGWNPEFFIQLTQSNQESQEIFEWFKRSSSPSNVYQIRFDGSVSLPYIGDIPAAGLSIQELTDSINSHYNNFTGLMFGVVLTSTAEAEIYVFGEVQKPGVFAIRHRVSLLHSISLAGGFTPHAKPLNTVVICMVGDTVYVNKIDSRVNMEEGASVNAPQSTLRFIQPGSIIFVPKKKIFTLAEYMSAIRSIMLFQGFGVGLQWRFGYDWYY